MASGTVPPAVLAATTNLRLRQSMLLGSALEGGWGPQFPVGDQGTSFGPYQMHEGGLLTATGLSQAQAENPRIATQAMMPYYEHAVNQISEQEWTNNPQQAAEQAAVIAESPSSDYYAQGAPVTQDWGHVLAVLQNQKSTGGMPVDAKTTAAGNPTGLPGSFVGGFIQAMLGFLGLGPALGPLVGIPGGIGGMIRSDLERIGLVIFGGLLVMVGIIILVMPAAEKGVQEAASLRRAGRTIAGPSGPSAADQQAKAADQARRQNIADRSIALGEQKLALQRQRENRLASRPKP